MANIEMRPFLRWAGSKKKLLPELSKYWDWSNRRYIEPFAGSARLFFHLQPESALLGDVNDDLVNTYNAVKKFPTEIYNELKKLPVDANSYYKIRSTKKENLNSIEQACRFIYLNRLCFNGLYRTNKKGEFNVPFGGQKVGSIPSEENFLKVSEILSSAKIINSDFESLIKENIKRNDFVYLDPPYAVNKKRVFNQYSHINFETTDIKRLSILLDYIDCNNAEFLLSYAYCDDIKIVAKKWNTTIVTAQRNIAGFTDNRKVEKEYLISNINK